MKIPQQVERALSKSGQRVFTRKEILQLMSSEHGLNEGSVIPSDYCYNRTNDGIDRNQTPDPKFLIFNGYGTYTYVGFEYQYSGFVYHQPKNKKAEEYIVGHWINGVYYPQEIANDTVETDVESILAEKSISATEKTALINARIGQGRFRQHLIDFWGNCAVTGYNEPTLLTASHIKPWRVSSNNEKLDLYNGLLLQPNLDKAFDRGLISFTEMGSIMISPLLVEPKRICIFETMALSLQPQHQPYMQYHREHVYRGG